MKPDIKHVYNQIARQRLSSIFRFILMFACYGQVHQLHAEQPLDFIAEHILEVPMDIRYQSFPKIPEQWDSSSKWLQIGGGEVSGGKMTSRFPMFSVNFYQSSDSKSGWLFSLFYENYQFSGRQGNSLLRPSFGRPNNLPSEFGVNVNNIDGSGYHFGGSAAFAFDLKWGGKLQLGLAVEKLHVDKFMVDFNSINLAENFAGSVNYAANYNIYSPFVGYQFETQQLTDNLRGSASLILVLPGPRIGFKGSFQGPGFIFNNSTDEIGGGKHIPDKFLGFSYLVKHQSSGITINLGGSLFSFLLEPLAHKDTDAPLFLTLSKSF